VKEMNPSLVMSFEADALKEEFAYMADSFEYRTNPEFADLIDWWMTRSDEEVERIGHAALGSDYLWAVWRQEMLDCMKAVMAVYRKDKRPA